MNITRLSSIIIKENRQRQEFDPEALQDLKLSIEYDAAKPNNQLFHPPVLRREGEALVLVAGERRLKVIGEIFELGGKFICNGKTFAAEDGLIPYTDVGELSELEAEEAELDENLKRRDLTWQEHAAAVARLHALRQQQNALAVEASVKEAEIKGILPSDNRPALHTIADTAEELTGRRDGSYQDTIRKEIIVARHLDNPAVAKAKSADEAFKILKREEARQKNVELAIAVGASFTHEQHTILHANCMEWMADPANEGTIDVICTDPPYGMGADEFGDAGGKMTGIEHHYDDSFEAWEALMHGQFVEFNRHIPGWCELSYRVAKPQAHAYVFCDIDNFPLLKTWMREAGWYVFRTPLTVHKLNSGRVPLPDQGPRRQTEWILYAIKGKKPVTHIYPDIITVNGDDNLGHGAQKPVALYQNLLQRSVRPGDVILDSFAGTGPILPAGHGYKCKVIAIEQSASSYATCVKRLEEIKRLENQLEIEGL